MDNTTAFFCQRLGLSLAFLRGHVRNLRIHGNGFLQADIEGRPGHHLHMFGHPAIPRQSSPTPIHDHRFAFESTVLAGCLVNVMWQAHEARFLESTHRVHGYVPGVGEDTKLVATEEYVTLSRRYPEVLTPGSSYRVRIGELHETFCNEPTLTYMAKQDSDPDYSPRVLAMRGRKADNSFDRNTALSPVEAWEMVEDVWRAARLPL